MATVHFTLTSQHGDRLGHLIRGVQMLRSYGAEADVVRCSDVAAIPIQDKAEPALGCVLEANSDATEEALRGICRETEWALGDEPGILTVRFKRYDGPAPELPHPAAALTQAAPVDGSLLFLHREEFAQLYDWGQQLLDEDGGLMGEWPSATGP